MKRLSFAGLIALTVALAPVTHAQYTADFQTNIIDGVVSNWTGSYLVCSNTFADVLKIRFGGALSVDNGYIGYEASASNNLVSILTSFVGGGTSAWGIRSNLVAGYSSAGNRLIIGNISWVTVGSNFVGASYIGYNASSSNNSVSVYSGSVWSNSNTSNRRLPSLSVFC